MNVRLFSLIAAVSALILCCEAALPHETLYHTLDPTSIVQQMAFYQLYPHTSEGKKALRRAWELLGNEELSPLAEGLLLPSLDVQTIVSLITRQPADPPALLGESELAILERCAKRLAHQELAGHQVWTEEEVIRLEPEQVDLARALLIYQFGQKEESKLAIRRYEASLDLMALQVLARLKAGASHLEKVHAINQLIFHELAFRFPPHSVYADQIDLYTFLPSVMDSREGVCLGVSILYLALAQRIGLPLEIVTPPGHIYLRYRNEKGEELNIETTARGIHLPTEAYLSVQTRSSHLRTIKEVIGTALVNQAATFSRSAQFDQAIQLYRKAKAYLPDDPLLQMLLGIHLVLNKQEKEGKKVLEPLCGLAFPDSVSVETMPEDYVRGHVNREGLMAIFMPVDEHRSSILQKHEQLTTLLKKYPRFRAGLLHLATTCLQLGRTKEALEVLIDHHMVDAKQSTVEYYLAILSLERMDYTRAWRYLKNAEALCAARGHEPKALKELKLELRHLSPEP